MLAFLLDKGYTNTEIGTLLAIGNIVSVIVQPISAEGWHDRTRFAGSRYMS